ncbi:inositol monophosphatase family protein [Fibrobacterota bacterium]
MIENNQELRTAVRAARAAGQEMKKNFGRKYHVIRKDPKEMVTEIDIRSQAIITEILNGEYGSYGIITEEKRLSTVEEEVNWIIDPIDGTHNFIAGLPFSGVSIGLVKDGGFYLGVIYFPIEDEMFYAVQGKGAFCNDKPIRVSENGDLSKAIINYDNQFHKSKKSFDYFKVLTQKAFTVRIFGTATRDLCYTASGHINGRIWNSTKICDIAAGIVIVTEAGGKVSDFNGKSCTLKSAQVVASNGKVHDDLLTILQ